MSLSPRPYVVLRDPPVDSPSRAVAADPLLAASGAKLYGTSMAAEKFPEKLSKIFFMLGIHAVVTERLYDICSQTVGPTASQVKSLSLKRKSGSRRAIIVATGHLKYI